MKRMARVSHDALMKASAHIEDLRQACEDAAGSVESAFGRLEVDDETDDAQDAIDWLTTAKKEADRAIDALSTELNRVKDANRAIALKRKATRQGKAAP
jgi:hypothetical protein